jgi:hypothetical protein
VPDRTCCVCNHAFVNGKTFTLTAEERASIGPQAPEQVDYCSACLNVFEDRDSGAQLLKGLYEMQLRQHGVPNARERSEKFHAKLLQATLKKLH